MAARARRRGPPWRARAGPRLFGQPVVSVVLSGVAVGTLLTQAVATPAATAEGAPVTIDVHERVAVGDRAGSAGHAARASTSEVFTTETPDATITIAVNEAVGVGDTAGTAPPNEVTASEAVAIGDEVGAFAPVSLLPVEGIAVSDDVGVHGPAEATAAEAVGVGDQAGVFPPATLAANDGVAVADQVGVFLPAWLTTDAAIGVTVEAGIFPPAGLATDDTVAVADQVGVFPPASLTIDDAIAFADVIQVLLSPLVTAAEAVGVVDVVAVFPPAPVGANEAVGVADAIAVTPSPAVLLAEGVGLADAVAVEPSPAILIADGIDVAGTVTVRTGPHITTADSAFGDEADDLGVNLSWVDADAADAHTVVIDWGDGTTSSQTFTAGERSASASHDYGDNGNYTITYTVTDIDGFSDSAGRTATIVNVAPTAAIDVTSTVDFPAGSAFVARAGVTQDHRADATDPGSDDLTFDWTDGPSTIHFNDGVGPDPLPSPLGTYPFSASDLASLLYDAPGMQEVEVTVVDDDSGLTQAGHPVLVTGTSTCLQGRGYWRSQYGSRRSSLDRATRAAYLAMVDFPSSLEDFDDLDDERATDLLSLAGSSRASAVRELLAAWLNHASGSIGWSDAVDLDGDGVSDGQFGHVVARAEVVIAAGDDEAGLSEVASYLEAINLRDEDAPSCEEAGGGRGGPRKP